MLQAGAQAILQLGRTALELEMAMLALLHTWGQLLNRHLHSHLLVPAGGLSLDAPRRWTSLAAGEFLPHAELCRLFRQRFLDGLTALTVAASSSFREVGERSRSRALLSGGSALADIEWVVRRHGVWDRSRLDDADMARRTVNYLARYVNRVAISNERLIAIDGEEVLFHYKDYRDGNQRKIKRMPGIEFIRRFLQHILPKGLRHIRRSGFMGPRVGKERLALIRRQLGVAQGAGCGGGNQQRLVRWRRRR